MSSGRVRNLLALLTFPWAVFGEVSDAHPCSMREFGLRSLNSSKGKQGCTPRGYFGGWLGSSPQLFRMFESRAMGAS